MIVKEQRTHETGLVLMDLSLNAIAFDKGATRIFTAPEQPVDSTPQLPNELLDMIRRHVPVDLPSFRQLFRIGDRDYACRAFLIAPSPSLLAQEVVALFLEREWAVSNTMTEVANAYHLTDREREVLVGLASMGLTNKEMAERMNIIPNTVKLFLRLIMVKMGVTTRAGIVAKLLQQQRMMIEGAGERQKAM